MDRLVRRSPHRSRIGRLAVTAGVAIALAGAARAGNDPRKAAYDQYCASCHGVAADGKGPVAPELKTPPPDLRQLGRKYGTPLPMPKLREVVDGRGMVRAHGTSDMPVWGDHLANGAPPTVNAEFFRRGTMVAILEYVATLQAK